MAAWDKNADAVSMSTEGYGKLTQDSETTDRTGRSRLEVVERISSYLNRRLGVPVELDDDIYDRGLVTSMFAMELVVQLEQAFSIEIVGSDLQLANFRSVNTMTDLVLHLSPYE